MHKILMVFVLSLPCLAFAGQDAASLPVAVSEVSANEANLSLDVTNISGKDILGYALAIDWQNSTGTRAGNSTLIALRGVDPSVVPLAIKAGEVTHIRVHQPNPESVGQKISVDFVLFADGSTWGPDKWKESKAIIATLRGRDLALSLLREKLEKDGPDAVVEFLKNFHHALQ